MNFKNLFNKAVTEAQSFLDKPETKELISKVKQGAVEFKQKAEVFVEESDEKLKKIIEEKFSKKNDDISDTEIKNDVEEQIKTTESDVQGNTTFTKNEHSADVDNSVVQPEQTKEVVQKAKRTTKKVTDIHISQMDFKENLEKTLAEAGFDTKNKLKAATDEQLLALSGIGKATLKIIREKSV